MRDALLAHPARLGRGPLLAVDHLRQDPRGGGLARSPRARRTGTRGARRSSRMAPDQRADDVVLADDLVRGLRPVLSVQRLVRLVGHVLLSPAAVARPVATWPPAPTYEDGDRAPAVDGDDSGAHQAGSSGQVTLRHPPSPAYRCFLPDLTGFASWRRAGPGLQRLVPGAVPDHPGLGREFSPARADCGYRAPLAPRLARSPRRVYAGRVQAEIAARPSFVRPGGMVEDAPMPRPDGPLPGVSLRRKRAHEHTVAASHPHTRASAAHERDPAPRRPPPPRSWAGPAARTSPWPRCCSPRPCAPT